MSNNDGDVMSDEDEGDSLKSQIPEKCFYASFKIYLNPDSRKNSRTGLPSTDGLSDDDDTGEVVRIEKTEEVSDSNTSDDDDKTLSLSNENILDDDHNPNNDTDIEDEDFEIRIVEEPLHLHYSSTEVLLPTSSGERRHSRSSDRQGSSRAKREKYEWTQSVDRGQTLDRSPVYYLDPRDWIRSEGSSPLPPTRDIPSPLPYKDKQPNPMKLLDSLGRNLDVLTESEENLSSELESINNMASVPSPYRVKSEPPTPLRPPCLHFSSELESNNKGASVPSPFRVKSEPPTPIRPPRLHFTRDGSVTPPLETDPPLKQMLRSRFTRDGSVTPPLETDPPLKQVLRSRSTTPLLNLIERQRKVAIPVLCSRAGRMAEQLVTPGGSPVHNSGHSSSNRRSLDVDALSLFHSHRLSSPRPTATRSLSTLFQMSFEDVRRSRQDTLGQAISSGNIQSLGK